MVLFMLNPTQRNRVKMYWFCWSFTNFYIYHWVHVPVYISHKYRFTTYNIYISLKYRYTTYKWSTYRHTFFPNMKNPFIYILELPNQRLDVVASVSQQVLTWWDSQREPPGHKGQWDTSWLLTLLLDLRVKRWWKMPSFIYSPVRLCQQMLIHVTKYDNLMCDNNKLSLGIYLHFADKLFLFRKCC